MVCHTVGKRFEEMGVGKWLGRHSCQSGLECCRLFHQSSILCDRGGAWALTPRSARAACVDLVEPYQNLPPTQPRAANDKTWKRRWLAAVHVHAKPGSNSRDRFIQVLDGFKHEVKREGISLESISVLQADLRCMLQSQK
jgi:hypothetical protein